MAEKTNMDPNFLALIKAFFEAGLNVGIGYHADPDDVTELFDRFLLLNSSDLEKVRLYRA